MATSGSGALKRPVAEEFAAIRRPGSIVDLFCGAGGLTHGLRQSGFDVVAGFDIDEDCRYAFEYNNKAPFVRKDVEDLTVDEINDAFYPNEPRILVGCAPCQPFSSYNQKNADPKWRLVERFADLIVQVRPDVVSMENVPKLVDFRDGIVFQAFCSRLSSAGYHVNHKVVFLPDYGLPQRRSRLVLLASLHGPISLGPGAAEPQNYITVHQAIGSLPPVAAGEAHATDPLHVASRLSATNLNRIKASKPGGTWKDWQDDLVASCHQAASGRGYSSVYGRMRNDAPSPTITTQFFGFGSGRFGHPTQDRALTLREGAILQSFPLHYRFVEPGRSVEMKRLGRIIGNAVPVLLGRVIGLAIAKHLEEHSL